MTQKLSDERLAHLKDYYKYNAEIGTLFGHIEAQTEEIQKLKEPAPSPDLEKLVDEILKAVEIAYSANVIGLRKRIADVLRPLVERSRQESLANYHLADMLKDTLQQVAELN